jgi:hypothetical protein
MPIMPWRDSHGIMNRSTTTDVRDLTPSRRSQILETAARLFAATGIEAPQWETLGSRPVSWADPSIIKSSRRLGPGLPAAAAATLASAFCVQESCLSDMPNDTSIGVWPHFGRLDVPRSETGSLAVVSEVAGPSSAVR